MWNELSIDEAYDHETSDIANNFNVIDLTEDLHPNEISSMKRLGLRKRYHTIFISIQLSGSLFQRCSVLLVPVIRLSRYDTWNSGWIFKYCLTFIVSLNNYLSLEVEIFCTSYNVHVYKAFFVSFVLQTYG